MPLPGDNDIVIAAASEPWSVAFHADCEKWADTLDGSDAEALLGAIRILRDHGPALGRPLVDSVKGSRHKNMKELRPGSTGRSEIRVLFAFDLARRGILLVGGDKSGDWSGWYTVNIPVADDRFELHQSTLQARRVGRSAEQRKRSRS